MAVCFLGGAAVATVAAVWLTGSGDSAPLAAVPAPTASAPAPRDPIAIPEEHMPELLEKLGDLERKELEQRPPEDVKPEPPPTQVYFPVDEQLAGEKLSEVPYQTLGAWDDEEAPGTVGAHRALVLLVDPGISDADLEGLARDVYRAHQDADRLDVRIYDRQDAAEDPRLMDAGRYAASHQLAQITRHRGLGVDVIRVRGRVVEP
jgi:hypothetical protein